MVPDRERIASRSLAYHSAFWKLDSAPPIPWMAVRDRGGWGAWGALGWV